MAVSPRILADLVRQLGPGPESSAADAARRLLEAQGRAERAHLRAADAHEPAARLYTRLGKLDRAKDELAKASRDKEGAEAE